MVLMILEIVFAIFGTYGLATLLSDYGGPKDIFRKLRSKGVPDCNVCIGTWLVIPIYLLCAAGFGAPLAVLGGFIILARWL